MRAQISIEAIIAVSLSILIFLGFFIFYINNNGAIKNSSQILKIRDECFKISNAIQSAVTLGDGYTTTLITNSTINFQEGTIFVSYNGKDTACSYRGDVFQGSFTGSLSIENRNNIITIKNV